MHEVLFVTNYHEFLWFMLSVKFKIEQFVIACEAANNSKLKIQNSKLFHRTRITRITRINTWWNFWLIHDNSWPKHHSASMKFFLSQITINYSWIQITHATFVRLVKLVVEYWTRITRITRINTWWNFWLIHDNSWPKHHSSSMKFFLSQITINYS